MEGMRETRVDLWIPRSVQHPNIPETHQDKSALRVTLGEDRIFLGDADPLSVVDDLEGLSARAIEWRREHRESYVIVMASPELALGEVQEAIAALLHRGDEAIFEYFTIAVMK